MISFINHITNYITIKKIFYAYIVLKGCNNEQTG